MTAAAQQQPTVILSPLPPSPPIQVVTTDGRGREIKVESTIDPRVEKIYQRMQVQCRADQHLFLDLSGDLDSSFWYIQDATGQVISRGRLMEALTDDEKKEFRAYIAGAGIFRRGQLKAPFQGSEKQISGKLRPDWEQHCNLGMQKGRVDHVIAGISREIQNSGNADLQKKWESIKKRLNQKAVMFALCIALDTNLPSDPVARLNVLKSRKLFGNDPLTKDQEQFLHEVVALGIEDPKEQRKYLFSHGFSLQALTLERFLVEKLKNQRVVAQDLIDEAQRKENYLSKFLPIRPQPQPAPVGQPLSSSRARRNSLSAATSTRALNRMTRPRARSFSHPDSGRFDPVVDSGDFRKYVDGL